MKLYQDAYGQEIWAYYQGEKSVEIAERDDGFIDISGGGFAYFREYKEWPAYQKEAIKFTRGRVLDIGAGAGRVALYLQKRCCRVTAIDNSPLAVRVCRKRGVKDARLLPIEKVNRFAKNTFDTIVMYGNNFGLFANPKKAKGLLETFHQITTPGAIIIAESNDPYQTKDPVHLAYHQGNRKQNRLPGQLKLRIRFRNYIGRWFEYLIVSQSEMRKIFSGTGWKAKKFFHSSGSMYIAIIQKY